MDRAEAIGRTRGALANLWRPAGPARMTPWAWAADAILALVLAVATVNSALHPQDSGVPQGPKLPFSVIDGVQVPPAPPAPPIGPLFDTSPRTGPWLLILAALTALPLVTRRRYPLASLWLIVVACQAYHGHPGLDATPTFVSCVIAAYSVTMYSRSRVLAVASVVVTVAWLTVEHAGQVPALHARVIALLLVAIVGLVANAVHTWKQRAQTLEREQEAMTRLAVDQERARLARELHDVVGHHVSVMVVQAGAARKVLDNAPEQAREALLAVESGGRAAMAELRHVIGLLTIDSDGDDPAATADLAPAPGLDQLPALAARVREAGVPVELTMTGPAAELPGGVDLAAYRVVQEALTNAMKHAAGARVAVTVERGADRLRVEIIDTGGTRTAAPGSGRGLIGLRERLAVYGGTLTAGPSPTGGYQLTAVLPIGGQN